MFSLLSETIDDASFSNWQAQRRTGYPTAHFRPIFSVTAAWQTWHGVRKPDCSCFCLLLFLQSRSGGNVLMSVGERLKEEADATGGRREEEHGKRTEEEKTSGRKSIMWAKHGVHLGQLPVCVRCMRAHECVCACERKGLYKGAEQPTPMYKYPRCCWWSREKGQSESAHPYHSSSFSLSLPSYQSLLHLSSPLLLLLHRLCIHHLSCCCRVSFHGQSTEDFTWQAISDLRLAWDERQNKKKRCKQNKTINYTFTEEPFENRAALMPSFFKGFSCCTAAQFKVNDCASIHSWVVILKVPYYSHF